MIDEKGNYPIRVKKLSFMDKGKLFTYYNIKQPSFYLGFAIGITIMLLWGKILF